MDASQRVRANARPDDRLRERPGGGCAYDESQSPPDSRSAIASAQATLPQEWKGCCCPSVAGLRFRFQTSLHRSRDAFCIRVIRPMRSGKSPRARGTPRGPTDPRKFRKKPASPPSLQRPARGVLRLSSAWPPVAEVSVHRCGLLQRLAVRHGVTALPPKNPVTPSVAPGPCSFSRRALGVRVAPVRGHREPVPLNDASRSALGWTGLGAV